MTKRPKELMHLEEGVLFSMAMNAEFVAEFPFLAAIKKATKGKATGCRPCGASNKERARTLQAAKIAVAGLADDKKKKLLSMLNTKKLRIQYRGANGRIVSVTIGQKA